MITVVGLILVIVILAIGYFFVVPWMLCMDCDNVIGHGDPSDQYAAPYWEIKDKEDYLRIGWMPGYCMGQSQEQKVCAIAQWWDSNGVKHEDRIGGTDSSDAIAKLDNLIDTFGMSDRQKRDSHHIIDCIQRGCK